MPTYGPIVRGTLKVWEVDLKRYLSFNISVCHNDASEDNFICMYLHSYFSFNIAVCHNDANEAHCIYICHSRFQFFLRLHTRLIGLSRRWFRLVFDPSSWVSIKDLSSWVSLDPKPWVSLREGIVTNKGRSNAKALNIAFI